MISAPASSGTVDAGADAPPPTSATSATPSPKGAFDAILALENLAATCNALDPAALEGVLEGLSESEGEDSEEGEEGELGALEFLAALLNTPTPFRPQPARQEPGAHDSADAAISAGAGRASPDAALLLASNDLESANDVSPDKLLAIAGQRAIAADGLTTAPDGAVDPAAQIARSAELFAQSARQAAAPAPAGIASSVRDPRWADEFATRMTMMVRGGESQASLQLSPVELGPMDVSVTVKDSEARIHFGAAQAETRALIEASIPRLREMLAAQGFNLMDASVSQGFSRQAQQAQGSAGGPAVEPDADVAVKRVATPGLLDLYA